MNACSSAFRDNNENLIISNPMSLYIEYRSTSFCVSPFHSFR